MGIKDVIDRIRNSQAARYLDQHVAQPLAAKTVAAKDSAEHWLLTDKYAPLEAGAIAAGATLALGSSALVATAAALKTAGTAGVALLGAAACNAAPDTQTRVVVTEQAHSVRVRNTSNETLRVAVLDAASYDQANHVDGPLSFDPCVEMALAAANNDVNIVMQSGGDCAAPANPAKICVPGTVISDEQRWAQAARLRLSLDCGVDAGLPKPTDPSVAFASIPVGEERQLSLVTRQERDLGSFMATRVTGRPVDVVAVTRTTAADAITCKDDPECGSWQWDPRPWLQIAQGSVATKPVVATLSGYSAEQSTLSGFTQDENGCGQPLPGAQTAAYSCASAQTLFSPGGEPLESQMVIASGVPQSELRCKQELSEAMQSASATSGAVCPGDPSYDSLPETLE